jgi:hypothetical protein
LVKTMVTEKAERKSYPEYPKWCNFAAFAAVHDKGCHLWHFAGTPSVGQ